MIKTFLMVLLGIALTACGGSSDDASNNAGGASVNANVDGPTGASPETPPTDGKLPANLMPPT